MWDASMSLPIVLSIFIANKLYFHTLLFVCSNSYSRLNRMKVSVSIDLVVLAKKHQYCQRCLKQKVTTNFPHTQVSHFVIVYQYRLCQFVIVVYSRFEMGRSNASMLNALPNRNPFLFLLIFFTIHKHESRGNQNC